MKNNLKSKRTLTLSLIILVLFSCGQRHSPFEPEQIEFPPSPQNLKIKMGDREIQLTWEIKEEQSISKYFVYRKDSLNTGFILTDSTDIKLFNDKDISNGQIYSYRLSALNKRRIEGPKSRSVQIAPNIYDLIIENGREYTNQKNVTVTLTAPQNTELMKMSNDSLFSDASWESYTNSRSWGLPGDDGIKYVYAKFRDGSGNETLTVSRDKIILDTRAIIHDLRENSAGEPLTGNDTLHVLMDTHESGGEAKFDIGTIRRGILLFDDGTNGDKNADDGIYELDYVIPVGLEVINMELTGNFIDAAENSAETMTTVSKVTIQASPRSVTLFKPTAIGDSYTTLQLTWSRSLDADFSMYKIFRSKTPGISTSSTLIKTIEDVNEIVYNDEFLLENTRYYYRVYVYDQSGLYNGSAEEFGNTNTNELPIPVVLISPSQSGSQANTLSLSWSQNTDSDFASYKVYRGENIDVDSSSILLTTIEEQTVINYDAVNLNEDKTYYFIVYVFDKGGRSSGSNTVIGVFNIQDPPTAVTLFPANKVTFSSLILDWSQNHEDDFASYRVFRSETLPVDSTSQMDTTITNQNVTSFKITGLDENTAYNFRVYVYNDRERSIGSNTISVTTETDTPPEAVTLYSPIAGKTSMQLSWSENNEDDFASYKIFRSDTSNVTISSQMITVISEKSNTLFTDLDLEEGTKYYYKIFVFDNGSNYTESNEVSAETETNEPPEPVELFIPTDITQSSVYLSWPQNSDSDFASYRIFRSKSPGVSNISQFVTIIIDPTITFFDDVGLDDSTAYYYKIYVYDTAGKFSESNEITVTTLENKPPEAPILSKPTVLDTATIRLSWSESFEEDFGSYRIYRSKTSPVDTSDAPIVVINNSTVTEYIDISLENNTEYYYVLRLYDKTGLNILSNQVMAKTE